MYSAKTVQNGNAWPAESAASRKIAYLINQYPKVSHSFIRREILALEEHGWSIFRVALRGWDADLVDPADIAERANTTFVLRQGALSLAMALVRQAVCAPKRFLDGAMASDTNDASLGSPARLASVLSC